MEAHWGLVESLNLMGKKDSLIPTKVFQSANIQVHHLLGIVEYAQV
jgi:hypothetical protein